MLSGRCFRLLRMCCDASDEDEVREPNENLRRTINKYGPPNCIRLEDEVDHQHGEMLERFVLGLPRYADR